MRLNYLLAAATAAALFASCDFLDQDYMERQDKKREYKSAWKEKIGDVDKNQTWISSNTATLNITVDEPSTVKAYTLGKEKRTLLGTATISGSGIMKFDIPQGFEGSIALYRSSASGESFKSVSIEDISNGIVNVAFSSSKGSLETKAAITDENRLALTLPTSVDPRTNLKAKIWGYQDFPGWIWTDICNAMPENATAVGQVNNFELQSNGVFYISLLYGVTGNVNNDLGYYYYDPANPSDITYVSLVNVLKGDYYYDDITTTQETALPKTLWKHKETGAWTPCNYDFYDKTTGWSGKLPAHKGDDQYNTYSILQKYGNDDETKNKIESVRGILFQIDAPKGNMVGFYINTPKNVLNHTTASLNYGKQHNAIIKMYDGFRLIGLEDSYNVAEYKRDCNDVVFAMVPGNDGTLPGVLLPYIKDITEGKYYNADGTWTEAPKYDEATDGKKEDGTSTNLATMKQTWTFAFEDMGAIGDFDFNDIVFRVTPDTESHTAEILMCATGGGKDADLYYKYDKIGEVHDLLGSTNVTNTKKISITPKVVATVDWPESNCMEKNAKDFFIIVEGEKIAIPVSGGIPKAVCIAGEWDWPTEYTCISEAYPDFGEWGANYSNKSYWDWYAKPAEGKTIGYHK